MVDKLFNEAVLKKAKNTQTVWRKQNQLACNLHENGPNERND
jgi:hypothetical protein